MQGSGDSGRKRLASLIARSYLSHSKLLSWPPEIGFEYATITNRKSCLTGRSTIGTLTVTERGCRRIFLFPIATDTARLAVGEERREKRNAVPIHLNFVATVMLSPTYVSDRYVATHRQLKWPPLIGHLSEKPVFTDVYRPLGISHRILPLHSTPHCLAAVCGAPRSWVRVLRTYNSERIIGS
jgi:hypothetical protein